MEKTGFKLTKIIGIYLFFVAVFLVIVTLVFAFSFNKVSNVRADDTEKQVKEWLLAAEKAERLDTDSFPENGDYVIEKDGVVTTSKVTNCKEEDMQDAIAFLKAYGTGNYLKGQEVFLEKTISDQTIYIHYSLKVDGEWLLLIAFIFAYILAILIPSIILIQKLRKMIYVLAEEKWKKEYETKQEMAQIAHDLKTPLTVIRGNADLLLEKGQDEDSRELIDEIIGSSERIARSVLDILEKDDK